MLTKQMIEVELARIDRKNSLSMNLILLVVLILCLSGCSILHTEVWRRHLTAPEGTTQTKMADDMRKCHIESFQVCGDREGDPFYQCMTTDGYKVTVEDDNR